MATWDTHKNILIAIFIGVLALQMTTALADSKITSDYQKIILAAKIIVDPQLSKYHLRITSNDNIVHFEGSVPSPEIAEKFVSMAFAIDSVQSVSLDKLTILTGAIAKIDIYVMGEVKGLLLRNHIFTQYEFDSSQIVVLSLNRAVTLAGNSPTQWQIDAAIRIAKSAIAVNKVTSILHVVK
jgi:osmotically-inducible protein OsmY